MKLIPNTSLLIQLKRLTTQLLLSRMRKEKSGLRALLLNGKNKPKLPLLRKKSNRILKLFCKYSCAWLKRVIVIEELEVAFICQALQACIHHQKVLNLKCLANLNLKNS